jgi:hypothetical protein
MHFAAIKVSSTFTFARIHKKKTFDFSSYYSDHFHYFYVTLHILNRRNLSFISISLICNRISYGIACAFIPHISSSFLFFILCIFFPQHTTLHSNISQFSCTFALYLICISLNYFIFLYIYRAGSHHLFSMLINCVLHREFKESMN